MHFFTGKTARYGLLRRVSGGLRLYHHGPARASLWDSRLDSCAFSGGTHALRALFRGACLDNCNFRQTPLTGADFTLARCRSCDFSACDLQSAIMSHINADGCLFIRADLGGASLDHARLIGALLQKCQLAGADLRDTNLFRADLSQSLIDGKTRMQGAYTHQCK